MGVPREATRRLEELRAGARFDRERRDLYRARVVGPRPTRQARLDELERAAAFSEERLRRAEDRARADDGPRLPEGLV